MVWRLKDNWSIVSGVGSDDSIRVHHVFTSQVCLTHFSQAGWRKEQLGHDWTMLD